MGDDSKSLTLFLGNIFIIGLAFLAVYLIYGLIKCCSPYDKCCKKMDLWLFPKMIWSTAIVYQQETYIDYCIGTMLRFEELHFNTPGDYFDFALGICSLFNLVVLPIIELVCLCKNKGKMDQPKFKSKWGSFYDGMRTYT